MQAAIRIRLDWVALGLGLLVALALVQSWRIEGGAAAPPAKVEIVTGPSSDLDVTPAGVTAEAQNLVPSLAEDGLRRDLDVRNATFDALDVTVAAVPDSPALGDALDLRVEAGGQVVYEGSLAGLAAGSQPFPLAAGQTAPVSVTAWIPESASTAGWPGHSVSVRLNLTGTGR